ncbi:MAG: cytochrome c biogenesis protein CcsA, partial [Rhodocyclaceae bacterium]|nr:cytochrome c biogenesis protein CcsA [Rhodocyclaceae bacterium]
FMPWLVGTALIHSLAVTEKRGSFKNWTVLLAIAAFSLSLLGTFLVRSGVLTSVHAFATDPKRGIFILILLAIVVGSSLLLFAMRAPQVSLGGRFALVSRETLLLVNNVLLVVAAGSVLLGTLYPLIVDALGLGKISVGPPYFNTVFVPIMLPLLVLVAAGPIARWKQADLRDLARQLAPAAVIAAIGGIALPFLAGGWHALTALSLALAVWIAAAIAIQTVRRLQSGNPPRAWWGMQLAHFGLAAFVVGAAMVSTYQEERDVRMAPGDTVTVGGHTFTFLGVEEVRGPNYTAARGRFELSRDGRMLRTLYPEKRNYDSSAMPMTEAAIAGDWTGHRYLSLGEPLGANSWSLRIAYKPLVQWIWCGCLLMALG